MSFYTSGALTILSVVGCAQDGDWSAFEILQEIALKAFCAGASFSDNVAVCDLDGLSDHTFEVLDGITWVTTLAVPVVHIMRLAKWIELIAYVIGPIVKVPARALYTHSIVVVFDAVWICGLPWLSLALLLF